MSVSTLFKPTTVDTTMGKNESDLRQDAEAEPNHQDRGDRDLGDGLRHHQERHCDALHAAAEHDAEGERHADGDTGDKAGQHRHQRVGAVLREQRPFLDDPRRHGLRRRQQIVRNVEDFHDRRPHRDDGDGREHRRGEIGHALAEPAPGLGWRMAGRHGGGSFCGHQAGNYRPDLSAEATSLE
jgi:hypothetical protein